MRHFSSQAKEGKPSLADGLPHALVEPVAVQPGAVGVKVGHNFIGGCDMTLDYLSNHLKVALFPGFGWEEHGQWVVFQYCPGAGNHGVKTFHDGVPLGVKLLLRQPKTRPRRRGDEDPL